VRVAPAASRAMCRKHTSKSPQVHRNTRHFLRNGFNGLFRALPGDRAFLPPSLCRLAASLARLGRASPSAKLDASVGASGPHDFAVRARLSKKLLDGPGTVPSKPSRRRISAVRLHAVKSLTNPKARPATSSARRRCRVHRIPPRVHDDRDTPLEWGGTAGDIN